MAHDVFVSHSSEDKPTADAVVARLEAAGVRCWVAPRDVTPGRPWGAEIVDAIEASRVMVLVFSKRADGSEQVLREVTLAVNRGVVVMPLRIENVMPSEAMEYFLTTPHWLDALTPPLDSHLRKLVDSVRSLLAPPESPPPAAEASPRPDTLPGLRPTTSPTGARRRLGVLLAALAIVAAVGIAVAVSRNGRPATPHREPEPHPTGVDTAALLAHARTIDAPAHRQQLQEIVSQVLGADPDNADAKAFRDRVEMYDPAWWVRAAITGGAQSANAGPTIGMRPGTWAQIALAQVRLSRWDEALATLKRNGQVVERFGVLQSLVSVAGEGSADVDIESLLQVRADQLSKRGVRLELEEFDVSRGALYFEVFASRLRLGDIAGAMKLMAAHPPSESNTPQWYAELVPAQVRAGDTAGAAATLKDWAAMASSWSTTRPTGTTGGGSVDNRRAAERLAQFARAQAIARDLPGLEKTIASMRTLAAPSGSFRTGHEEADWWARVANLRAMAGDMPGTRAATRAFDAAQAIEKPEDPTKWSSTFIVAIAEARVGDLVAVRRRIGEPREAGDGQREIVIGGAVDLAIARAEWERAAEWAAMHQREMARAQAHIRLARAALAKKQRDVFDRAITAIRGIASPNQPAVVWYAADFGLAGAYLAAGDRALAAPIVRDLPARAFDLMAAQPTESRGLGDATGPAANLLVRAGAWDRLPDAVLDDISDPDERARACLGIARGLIDELAGAPPMSDWRERTFKLEDALDPHSEVEEALQ